MNKDLSIFCIKAITNLYDDLFGNYPEIKFDTYKKFNYDSCDGAIGTLGDTAYILFSGSNSIEDWIMNFNFQKVEYKMAYKKKIKVHKGFQDHYYLGRLAILEKVSRFNKIVVTGHSLGAATTTLCALDLKILHEEKEIIPVLFASPRVGNKRFSKFFNKIFDDVPRWNYMNDIVPKVPPFFFGFQHVGNQIEVTTWKEKFEYNMKHPFVAIFGTTKDHDLKNYQKIIGE